MQYSTVKHAGPNDAAHEQQEIALDLRVIAENKLGINLTENFVSGIDSQDGNPDEQPSHEDANEKDAASEIDLFSNLVYRMLDFGNEVGHCSPFSRVDALGTPNDGVGVVDEDQKVCYGKIEQDSMTSQCPEVRFTMEEPTPKIEPKPTSTASIAPHLLGCFDDPTVAAESSQTVALWSLSPAQPASSCVTPARRQPRRKAKDCSPYGKPREPLSPESDASEPSPLFSPRSSASTPMTGEIDIRTEESHYFSKARRAVEQESPLHRKSTTRSSRELDPVPAPNFGRARKTPSHARMIKPDPDAVKSDEKTPTTHNDDKASQDTPPIDTVRHNEIDSNKKISRPCRDTNTSQRPRIPQLPAHPVSDGEIRLSMFERACGAGVLSTQKDLPPGPDDQQLALSKEPVKTGSKVGINRPENLNLKLGEYFVQSLEGIQDPEPSISATPTRRGGFRFTPLKTKKYASALIYELAKPVKCRRSGYIYCFSDELTPGHVNIGSAMIPARCEDKYGTPTTVVQPQDDPYLGKRLQDQRKACSLKMVVHFAAYMPCAVRKIETLVHLTLRSEKRRATQCVGGECQKQHIEWFDTKPERALLVVKTWQRFSCLFPYRMQGYVENAWENRVGNEERCLNRKREPLDWFEEQMDMHIEQLAEQEKKGLNEAAGDIEQDKLEPLAEKGKVRENEWLESLSNSEVPSLRTVLLKKFPL